MRHIVCFVVRIGLSEGKIKNRRWLCSMAQAPGYMQSGQPRVRCNLNGQGSLYPYELHKEGFPLTACT